MTIPRVHQRPPALISPTAGSRSGREPTHSSLRRNPTRPGSKPAIRDHPHAHTAKFIHLFLQHTTDNYRPLKTQRLAAYDRPAPDGGVISGMNVIPGPTVTTGTAQVQPGYPGSAGR